MLFAALLAFVGVAKAEVTDLPLMSTGDEIKWYTISNTRSTSGKYLYWTESGVKDADDKKMSSLFYFTGTAEECYIHNAATNLLFTGAGAWNETGVKCKISVTPYGDGTTGLAIEFSGTALNESNTGNGYTTWGANDAGSVFVIEEAPVAQMAADYKTAAIAALDGQLKFLDIAAAKAAIEAIPANIDAFAAIDAEMNKLAELVAFRNGETDANSVRYNSYLAVDMAKSKGNGIKSFDKAYAVWALKYAGGSSFYVYNVNQKVYLGNPDSKGQLTPAPVAAYTLNVVEGNKVELKFGNQVLHMNNHNAEGTVSTGNALTNWGNDVASHWYVETDFAVHVEAYKISALTSLDEWNNLSVVFDAELIETAKTAINAINTTDYATFAAIDAELKKVTDKVAEKYFTFKNDDKANSARIDAYLAANASTNKGCGTKTFDYNAIWRLLSAGGTSFYLYNELNNVYLKNPSSGDLVADAAQAATYTFEIIDAATNKAELKSAGQTLHLAGGLGLMNYDSDDAASRWYIATYDYKADLNALLESVNEGDCADVPALGQYPTAAYNALVEANESATTVVEVAEAVAAFKASLNRPVYFITSKNEGGYSDGAAIYYDGAWKWGTANIYNKQMWMTIPGYTEENVPVVEAYNAEGTSYAICDYLTGTKMRGKDVQIVKVAGWDGVVNLQYGTATNDAVQHAQSGGALVGWNPAIVKEDGTKDCGASAWYVEFIGTSYELDQLTDEYFAAVNELAAINVPNFSFAAGVNNYDETTKPALDDAIANRTAVLGKFSTADEIAAAKTQLEAAIAGVQLNMPVNGKFYRVRCADQGTGMRRLQSTINNDRLQMIGGADGINANSIFCYINGSLLSYTTGQYINAYNFDAVGTKSTVTFSNAYNGTLGQYNIKINDTRYIYGKKDEIDSGTGNPTDGGYNWWLEEVTELPVTVSAAGYATLYAPVALTIPAEGVTVYTATVEDGYLALTEVEGAIPANTGVIIEAAEGTYNFAVVAEAAAIESELVGAYAKSEKNADAKVYTLQKPAEKEVGFYLFKGQNAQGTTYINGFRAWIEVAEGEEAPAMFAFGRGAEDDEESTGIESVELNGELVIYDLAGRRVEKMEKGIYIVNGRKVVVK